jgi:Membrane magnesium transporter
VYSLPLDIKIETIVSVFMICFGLVAGAEPLKPISWNVWAGNIEKEGGAANPFRSLEERSSFLDIRVSALSKGLVVGSALILTETRRSGRSSLTGSENETLR